MCFFSVVKIISHQRLEEACTTTSLTAGALWSFRHISNHIHLILISTFKSGLRVTFFLLAMSGNSLFWQKNPKIHIKMCICAICLQNACCMLINYWPLMWVNALFAPRKRAEFIPSLMTLSSSKPPALCCFTASLVTSAVLVQEREEGHLSKLRWSFTTHPPSDKICATQHACFMMSETRHSELQNISTDAVFCFCFRFSYLNSCAGTVISPVLVVPGHVYGLIGLCQK